MTNKEIFNQNMDELADAINEKAQTYGKKTVTEMTSTVKDIHIGAVDSVNGRIGDVVLDKADVNLGNVDNTSDLDKPVSTATQVELGKKQNTLTAGAGISITEEGVISADTGIKVQVVETLPATGDTKTIYLKLAEEAETDNVYDEYIYVNNAWEKIGTTEIDLSGYVQKTTTIAGISLENNIAGAQLKAALELAKNDVGLGNVDNTSDLNKPISTATQTALNNKLSKNGGIVSGTIKIDNGVNYILKTTENTAILSQATYAGEIMIGDTSRSGGVTLRTAANGKIKQQVAHSPNDVYYDVLTTKNTIGNPTLAGTEDALTSLKIDDVVYKIPTFDPTSVTGYDASKSQILTHNAQGVMTWIDAAAAQSGSEVTLP